MKGNGYYSIFGDDFPCRWDDKQPMIYRIDQTNEFRQAFALLKEWKEKEYVALNNSSSIRTNRFAFKNIASRFLEIRSASVWLNAELAGVQNEYSIYPLYMDSTHTLKFPYGGISVGINCKYPERLIMFIEWIHSSQEAYDLFTYGVKDRNYVMEGEKIGYTSEIKHNYNMTSWSESFFSDDRYRRLYTYEPDKYKQVYIDAALKNVKTIKDEMDRFGLRSEIDEDTTAKLHQEYEKVSSNSSDISKNIYGFYSNMDKNNFSITPDKLSDILDNCGIDKYMKYLEKRLESLKSK